MEIHGGELLRAAERLALPAFRETSDDGRPITVSDPGSPHAQLFREIAAKVWSKVSGEGARRAPPRIVVE